MSRMCNHEQQVMCLRTIANGRRQYGQQCSRCGNWRAITKTVARHHLASVVEYDPHLRERWWDEQQKVWQEESAIRRRAWEVAQAEWETTRKQRYEQYMATPAWENKRRNVLRRDKGLCQARLPGCGTVATQVHHRTYDHFENEPLFDLEAVCVACHEQITEMDRARRG